MECFENKILTYLPSLNEYAYRLSGDQNDAKDLVQDTILKALENKFKLRSNSNLKGWLVTIMRNLFINGYRRKHKLKVKVNSAERSYLENTERRVVQNSAELNLVIQDYRRIIKRLVKEDLLRVFDLSSEGFSYQEIAEMENLPLSTIKSRIFVSRKILRETFSEN